MIANSVPRYFEPALVDWSFLSSFDPRVAVWDVPERVGADRPVEFSVDDRSYLVKRQ
jgi:hypothetical protein